MNSARKQLVVAALVAGFGLAAGAQTAPPPPQGGPAPMAREGHGRPDPAQMQERMAARLNAFKQKLQISAAQEGAWNSYVAALKPSQRPPRPDRAEIDKLSTPERIDRMRAMRARRTAEMDRRLDATKTFYAVLTPEQKKIFDEQTAHHGHRGHDRGHHRHPMGW